MLFQQDISFFVVLQLDITFGKQGSDANAGLIGRRNIIIYLDRFLVIFVHVQAISLQYLQLFIRVVACESKVECFDRFLIISADGVETAQSEPIVVGVGILVDQFVANLDRFFNIALYFQVIAKLVFQDQVVRDKHKTTINEVVCFLRHLHIPQNRCDVFE